MHFCESCLELKKIEFVIKHSTLNADEGKICTSVLNLHISILTRNALFDVSPVALLSLTFKASKENLRHPESKKDALIQENKEG